MKASVHPLNEHGPKSTKVLRFVSIRYAATPPAACRHLRKDNFVPQHERAEYRMHLFGDRVTLALGNPRDGDCGYTTVTTVRADPNATVDSSRCKRQKKFGESSCSGIPPKLRLEHFADAGERIGSIWKI